MIALGLDPFGGPDLGPIELGTALSRLEGEGGLPRFPDDYDTEPHAQELGALGAIASHHAATLDRAAAQAFVNLATQLLEEWERVHQLPSDSARTLAQRWSRLVAKEAFRGADRSAFVAAVSEVCAYADAQVTADAVQFVNIASQNGLEPWAALQYVLSMGVDFDDAAKRRALSVILRGMPTYRLGQMDAPGVDRVFVRDALAIAVYASTAVEIGQAPILKLLTDPAVCRNEPSRMRSYGPHSRIDARDLNALQDFMGAGPCTSWSGGLKPAPGHLTYHFTRSVAAAGDLALDTGINWRSRCISLVLTIDTTDIRPIGAAELSANLLTVTERYSGVGFWTTGGVGQVVAGSTGVGVYADAVNGNLRIRNTAGGTRHVIGMISASEVLA